ncbi:hypothetical protein G6514_002342 [Epicoccum nigrum]|nr:hypothetical protein G6514_002342 [Epicoccum nigrum]
MFSRTIPRAAPRISALSRYQAQSLLHRSTKLPIKQCSPLQQQLGRRYKSSSIGGQFKAQFKRSPVLFPFAVVILSVLSGMCLIYLPWYYKNVIIKPYHNFPEPVAKKLRKALFYSRGKHIDIREANKFFRQALQTADELGMDPFSDEIMGVKYTIAALFEDAGYYSLATDVLEIMRADTQKWMDEFSHKHWNDGNRSRVLKNLIQINVKLGQLYDIKYINEPENGGKRLVEAVETALAESQRREKNGLFQGEGEFLTKEELGGALEALGSHYEEFGPRYLATPLFVKALELCPPKSCHSIILMNNISTCLSQQSPPPNKDALALSSAPTDFPVTNAPPRAVLLDQARQWATKALAHAAAIPSTDKTEECDIGCAVATHNLGEFYEMEGKIAEARQKYEEAASLAKSMGFKEGQTNARAGLRRLKELEKKA